MKERIQGEIVPFEKRNLNTFSFIPKRQGNNPNVHLHKDTYHQQQYNINQNFTTQNTTTTTYNTTNTKPGIFSFLISFIIFPIKLIYSITKFIWIKYDLSEKLRIERQKIRIMKLRKKIVGRQRDNWNMDEIF